jgi:predicted Zn-dependent peptidase
VAGVVNDLRSTGPSAEELQRAQAIVETEFVSTLQSAGDRADRISQFATYLNDPQLINEHLDRYSAVERDDIRQFADRFLGPDNRASLMYVPRA